MKTKSPSFCRRHRSALVCLTVIGLAASRAAFADTDPSLGEAVDAPTLPWSTGGVVPWFAQSDTTHDESDAVQGSVQIVGDRSWIETTVAGPGQIGFYWKCWTAWPTYDRLALYLDGELLGSIPGGADWESASFEVPAGSHALRWVFEVDSEPWPIYGAWLDEVTFTPSGPPPLTLAAALDATHLDWTTGGAVPWWPQTNVAHDGLDAAQGTVNIMNDRSWLASTVNGPARLSFLWKCSSYYPEYNRVAFYIDGTLVGSIPGQADWTQASVLVPPGEHEVKWVFEVDAEPTAGFFNAWLDEVTLDTNVVALPPSIVRQPAAQTVPTGGDAVFTVVAEGTPPLRYQWLLDGSPLAGETGSRLVLTNVQPGHAGPYQVIVDNGMEPATSAEASLTVVPARTAWAWATQGGGAGWVNGGNSVAVDPEGNLLVTGGFTENGYFGPIVLTNSWPTMFFLAKYNPAGQVLWARAARGSLYAASVGYKVVTDAAGNAYVAGTFMHAAGDFERARMTFGTQTVVNAGWFEDVFLVKYNPSGEALWARRLGGPRQDFVHDLAVDAAGNAWVAASFGLVRFDADGGLRGSQQVDGLAGYELALDPSGKAYLSGRCSREITLDGFTVGPGLFVAGFSPEGTLARALTLDTNCFGSFCSLACDAGGDLFVAGGFQGTVNFDGLSLAAGDSNAVFLAKFDAAGTAVWAREVARSATNLNAQHLFFDGAGLLYLAMGFDDVVAGGGQWFSARGSDGVLLAKLDAAGDPHWAVKLPAGAATGGRAFAADATGRVYSTGSFSGTVDFGTNRITCGVVNAMYLARLNGNLGARPAAATRDLPAVCQPGVAFPVFLHVAPDASTAAWAAEDRPPDGWTVGAISDGGGFDSLAGRVVFGPFTGSASRVVSYEVTSPADARGPQRFAGLVSCDGINTAIGGDVFVEPTPLRHPADLAPADSILSGTEADAYSAAWRDGLAWPVPPNPIPIDYVTRAVSLAANGGCYEVLPSEPPPLCWIPCPDRARSPAQAARSSGNAVRFLPEFFVPGEPVTVEVSVTPAPGVQAYAAEDIVPIGWTVASISDGGEMDAARRKVKWGPFPGAAARLLTYQVVPPADASGVFLFSGAVSFDGGEDAIAGPRQIASSCRLAGGTGAAGGPVRLQFTTPLGAILQIQSSTNLADWISLALLTNVTGTLECPEPRPSTEPLRFYRATLFQ